jgi:hypothetical protein
LIENGGYDVNVINESSASVDIDLFKYNEIFVKGYKYMGYFALGPDYSLSAGSFLIEDTTPNSKFELPTAVLISIIIGSVVFVAIIVVVLAIIIMKFKKKKSEKS